MCALVFLIRYKIKNNMVDMALAAHGESKVVEREVNADYCEADDFSFRGHVGRRWICYANRDCVLIERIERFVWAYHEIVEGRGGHSNIVLWTDLAETFVLRMPNKEIQPFLDKLSGAAPWMNIGWTYDIRESWDLDRTEFIAQVAKRRASAMCAMSIPSDSTAGMDLVLRGDLDPSH